MIILLFDWSAATMFCEFWKRRQNELDYDWDLFGFEEQEVITPFFFANQDLGSKLWKKNP